MKHMKHQGHVTKDNHLWAASCSCSLAWKYPRWRDAFDIVFYHVRQNRKSQALGIGFRR